MGRAVLEIKNEGDSAPSGECEWAVKTCDRCPVPRYHCRKGYIRGSQFQEYTSKYQFLEPEDQWTNRGHGANNEWIVFASQDAKHGCFLFQLIKLVSTSQTWA